MTLYPFELFVLVLCAYLPVYLASLLILIPYLWIDEKSATTILGVSVVHFITSFSLTFLMFLVPLPFGSLLGIVDIPIDSDLSWPIAPGAILTTLGSMMIFFFYDVGD